MSYLTTMTELDYNLLGKVLNGEATEEEKKRLYTWVEQSAENKKLFGAYRQFYDKSIISEFYVEANRSRQFGKKRSVGRQIRFTAVAASLLLCIVFAFLFYSNRSGLTGNPKEVSSLVVKSNPKGQKSKITMPDGSTIWLNSDSRIEYLDDFNDSVRSVTLSGEAFFEVATDYSRPFVVVSDKLKATVLGTSFNMNAYPEDEMVFVSLFSGELSVASETNYELLRPGHQVQYDKSGNSLKKQTFDPEKIGGWKNGILVFDQEDFDSVISILERWYGVDVELIGSNSENWKFTGYFDNEYLKNVLEVICHGKKINYEIEGKHVTLILR